MSTRVTVRVNRRHSNSTMCDVTIVMKLLLGTFGPFVTVGFTVCVVIQLRSFGSS